MEGRRWKACWGIKSTLGEIDGVVVVLEGDRMKCFLPSLLFLNKSTLQGM